MVFTVWVENPSGDVRKMVVLCVPQHDVEKDSPQIRSQ
jgi:hypothetical protein